MLHKEILTKEQIVLLPLVKKFSRSFFLVGGTAIALHIGHRKSIDFDLFSHKSFDNNLIWKKISGGNKSIRNIRNQEGQYSLIVNGVYFTFFEYPYVKVKATKKFGNIIKLPDLLTLSAMKAYALGRRAKWKDYVDMYFIIRDYYSVEEISKKAKEVFNGDFNAKMFRAQLAYFKDIDYSEKIDYLKGQEVSDEEIKQYLRKRAIEQ